MKRLACCLLILVCVLGCIAPAQQGESASPVPATEAPATPEQIETDVIEIRPNETQKPDPTFAPTAAPTEAPTPESTPEPTPEPTPVPPKYAAADGVYTIAWISDPQHYSEKFPDVYYAMTAFLRDHAAEMNLAYIIHTGDFVNHSQKEEEWEVADAAQAMIDDIPNGVLAGNHDVTDPASYRMFCRYFGEKRYADKPWYGESYKDNRGHYDLLTLGGTDYVFVYMGFEPDKAAFQWVKDAFAKYPARVGVLCLHDYYTKQLTLSEDGQKWYDQVVKTTPNLYMVLCGHKYGSYLFPEDFDDDGDGSVDRTVYQMLFNYQATMNDGGGGYLRLIRINEADGTMLHLTYSPPRDDFNRFDDPAMREDYYPFDERNEEFTVPLPWRIEH